MLNGQFSLKKGPRKMGKKKERGLSLKEGLRKMGKKKERGLSLKEGPRKTGKKKRWRLLIRTEKYSKHMDSGALGKAKRGSRVI